MRPKPRGPVRVVIVEDRPVARKLLETELQGTGIEVVGFCRNGREAVERARTDPPDVLVMDIVMPEMNGIDATHEIRRFSQIGIVLLTGSHQDAETLEQIAKRRGADAFLLKPSGPVSADLYKIKDELVATIKRVAAKKAG